MKMQKKGKLQMISNSRTITFVVGGAIIGYLLSQNINGTIIGGVIGFGLSFIK